MVLKQGKHLPEKWQVSSKINAFFFIENSKNSVNCDKSMNILGPEMVGKFVIQMSYKLVSICYYFY